MRKILYSPGYGAGWTTWCSDINVRKFMLEYQPLILALESGTNFEEALIQFKNDVKEKFGEEKIPYLGGSKQLKVYEVHDGLRIRINEYDGFESVEIENEYDDWM